MSNRPESDRLDTSGSGLSAATDRRGLAWPIQLVILVGFLVLAVLSSAASTGAVSLTALVIAPIAWALQWGAMWVAHRWFLNRPWWRRHGFWSSMILLFIIIMIAIITGIIGGSASVTDGWTVVWRWAITVLVISLAVLSIDYRHDVHAQRQVNDDLHEARIFGIEQVMAQRAEVVTRMFDMLQEAVAAASRTSSSASEIVQGYAREQVRPMSHELMRSLPVMDAPRVRSGAAGWREVVGRITAAPLIRPVLMAIAVTVLFIFTTVETRSSDEGIEVTDAAGSTGVNVTVDLGSLLTSLLLLALVFAATWASSWAMLRATRDLLPRLSLGRRLLVALATPLAITVVVQVVIQVASVVPGFSDDLGSNRVDRLWLTVPIVVVAFGLLIVRGLVSAITSTRRDLQRSTADLAWENSRLRNSLGQERQFFSTQLHGPIQSVAAAAALRLESLGEAADPRPVLDEIERDLTGAIHALAQGPPEWRDVRAEITNLVGTWVGVCEVDVDIPDSIIESLDADWVAAGTAMDLLVDAVANAAMHGRAVRVWISAEWMSDDEVAMTVTNDGSTDLGESRGMGSALLDESCVWWSREQFAGAVRLSFAMAVPRAMTDRTTLISSV